jgi:hypothetical protein
MKQLFTLIIIFTTSLAFPQCSGDIISGNTNSPNFIPIYAFNSNNVIIDTIQCNIPGNSGNIGNVNCSSQLSSLPAEASYLSFSAIVGSCIYDPNGQLLDSSLPIELNYFNVSLENSNALIEWETLSETNNEKFLLEKSIDGENWVKFSSTYGAGTSTEPIAYRFIDESPYMGTSYYRLKQVDYNGDYSYSQIQSLRFYKKLQIFPNPFDQTIEISGDFDSIIITDLYGKIVKRVKHDVNHKTLIHLLNQPGGIYFLKTKNQTYK